MKKSKSQVETLKDQITSLEQQILDQRAKVDTFAAERSSLIRNGGTDAAIDDKEREVEGAIKAIARSEERLAALRENLGEAEAAAADAVQSALVEKANRAAQDAANGLHALWRDMTPKLRAALRAQAEADALIEQANKGRSPGDALLNVERRLRYRPAVKPEVISEKTVKRWAFEDTDRLVPEDRITNTAMEIISPGVARIDAGWGLPKRIELRDFVERRSLPARRASGWLRPLAASVSLPALRDGEPAGWVPLEASASPAAILRALDELEAAPSADDDRKEIVEIIPLERALAQEIDDVDHDELDEDAA